jgi:hypothetical protein
MFKCERCGAVLPPNTDQCAYCGSVSTQARLLLQTEAAQRMIAQAPVVAHAAVQKRVAQTNAEQAASRALMWGLLSWVFLCIPFPSVLAVLAFNRAKKLAREGEITLPTRATVGLVFGLLTGMGFIAIVIAASISVHEDNERVAARKAELAALIAKRGSSSLLDHDFACQLAELSLLSDGFQGSTNSGEFRDLACAGALRIVKDRAELGDFKLHTSSSAPAVSATICFKRGNSWFVERTGITSCELGK